MPMGTEFRDYRHPVDCIVDAGHAVVLCSYKYDSGSREGRLQFVDKESMSLLFEIPTSGTLHAFRQNDKLYCADSAAITAVQDQKIVASLETESLNTYISGGSHIYASSTSGEIMILTSDLELVDSIRVTREPVWVAKQFGDCLYFGDESGCCYRYSLASKSHVQIGKKRLGILDILFDSGLIYVSSYDGNLEIYCASTLEFVDIKHTGPLWRIEKAGCVFACACMYEGMKVFDRDFNLLGARRTGSICYGLCITSQRVLWSSFYDNTVHWAPLDELFREPPSMCDRKTLQNTED